MRVIEGATLNCQGKYDIPRLLEDVEFRRCTVEICQSPPRQRGPEDRPVIRNVRLVRCHVTASDLPPVIAEDCEIDTIWFHRGKWGPQRMVGCAFRHVVIRGNVTGSLAFTPGPAVPGLRAVEDATRDSYVVANRRFYEGVDWALDIREARFTSVEFSSGIPAALIRRDLETQVVLRRSSLVDGSWQARVKDTLATIWIEDLLLSGFDDCVLVAAKRGRGFSKEIAAIGSLRDAGLLDEAVT
jgi:hypothetical protein